MIKCTLILIFCIQGFTANCQINDTVRTYNYDDGPLGFSLQTKNNKTFTIIRGLFADTINGELTKQNNRYVLSTDTTLLNKRRKKLFAGANKSIWLEMHPLANAPLMHISTDTMQWLHLDTSQLSNVITGNYFVSTGFTGCQIQVTMSKITFLPFSDVGADEGKEVTTWKLDSRGIKLKGKSYLDKWFTDSKRFYVLPYFIVGRKTKVDKEIFTETFTYFIKSKE